tara:strand:- start:250 stop:417 length:168 start_codon:yes stop_codon:yes gene_type:complete
MNYKILFIIILIFLSGCKLDTINKTIDYDNKFYTNKGFALVYSEKLLKDKITKKK